MKVLSIPRVIVQQLRGTAGPDNEVLGWETITEQCCTIKTSILILILQSWKL